MKKLISFLLTILILVCFSQVAIADIYDDFNDDEIDTNKWIIFERDIDTTVVENNGVLNIDYPPSSKWGGLRSKALFGGDFDFRAEWKNWQFSGNLGDYQTDLAQIGIQADNDTGSGWGEFAYIFRGCFPTEIGDKYISNAYIDDTWRLSEGDDSAPSDTSGYFGIERVGSTINTYYSDVNHSNYDDWNHLNQIDDAFTDPIALMLRAYTGDYTNSFHAEWDNVEVEADSITLQNLEQPDEQRALPDAHLVDLIDGDSELDPDKSTILITHGMNGNINDWITEMGNSLELRLGTDLDNYNLAAWSWEKEASVSEFFGIPTFFTEEENSFILKVAEKQGNILAEALYGDGDDYTKDLHLLGHSAGGSLIETVAHSLNDKGIQVDQLTYLDAPGAMDASVANWADNYQSLWGNDSIEGAYNYILSERTHGNAHKFYNLTIEDASYKNGFYWSTAGGDWDEMERNLLLNTTKYQDASPPEPSSSIVILLMEDTFDEVGFWSSFGNVLLSNGMAFLKEASPAYLFENITIPVEANYFGFDFKFGNLGDGDYLTAHFNDDLLFWFEGTQFYGDDFWYSSPINISPYAGQYGTLTFALNSVGDANSELWIDNLEFYNISSEPIPEPSTCILLGIGLVGFFLRRKRFLKIN